MEPLSSQSRTRYVLPDSTRSAASNRKRNILLADLGCASSENEASGVSWSSGDDRRAVWHRRASLEERESEPAIRSAEASWDSLISSSDDRLPQPTCAKSLIQAADRHDSQTLAALCQQHQQEIRESFPLWRQVPERIRNDRVAMNRYCQGLAAVAQLFEQAGDQSLIALFLGNGADNPIMAWERDLAAAQSLIDNGRPGEAIELLQSALAKNAELRGSGVDRYLPRTYGMLGVAYFRTGDRDKAVEFTEKAKVLCEQLGDEEGVAVYAGNLQHVKEGGTVIFRAADGRTLTLEELRDVTGTFRYEIIGNTNVPAEAESLHKKARQAGWSGRLPESSC